VFGRKNGVSSYQDLRDIIFHYRESRGRIKSIDPEIGCSILAQPFFFERENWIPIPEDWKSNIVRGKMYDTDTHLGNKLYQNVLQRLNKLHLVQTEDTRKEVSPKVSEQRYGQEYPVKPRLGQGSFRVLVTDAYQRRCAMTGEKTLPALEAAHIQAYSKNGPHLTNNGLLLRADLHRLFDRHYLTITSDLKIEVSQRIHEEFKNGRDYYRLHGKKLAVIPENREHQPSLEYIEWHNNQFRT
jgi:putative restriction endonuclease